VGLIGSAGLVAVLDLQAHGVAVLGSFAHTAPSFGLSEVSWSSIRSVLPLAAVVALVVVIQSAATTRSAADQGAYEVDVSRDLLGVGAGNVLAGLAGAFPVDASPPGTAAVASAGGRTQLATLGAAAVVVVLVPAAGLLNDVPLSTLAAVLMFVAIRIFHARDLASVFRFDAWEFGLAVVTLLTVALIGVEQGIGVAVGLAILDRARLSARPHTHIMARVPGSTSWEPFKADRRQIEVAGVLVVLSHLSSRPHVLVLDVVGMHDIDFTGARALNGVLDELDPPADHLRPDPRRWPPTREPRPQRPARTDRHRPPLPQRRRRGEGTRPPEQQLVRLSGSVLNLARNRSSRPVGLDDNLAIRNSVPPVAYVLQDLGPSFFIVYSEVRMADVYRVTEIVGVSSESWEAAARVAVETAAQTVRELRVAEVVRQDLTIQDGSIINFRVRLGISFRYERSN
jgi:MFS superfamily sulfate permease-like transporter/flavin-binding protein dodecin